MASDDQRQARTGLGPEGLARLSTVRQVADLSSLSESTVRREIRLRRLAVVRIGRAVRIAEADLLAWLDRNRKGLR